MRFIVLSLLFFVVSIEQAFACSCQEDSLEKRVIESADIFIGTISDVKGETIGRCGSKVANMAVTQQLKGQKLSHVQVSSSDGCTDCGMYLVKGVTYLMYGGVKDGHMGAWMCGGNKPVQHAKDEIERVRGVLKEIQMLDAAIAAHPKSFDAYINKVDFLMRHEAYQEAMHVILEAQKLRQSTSNVNLWLKLAKTYEMQNDFPHAIAAYQHALSITPRDLSIKQSIQRIQLGLGMPLEKIFPGKNADNADFSEIRLRDKDFIGFSLKRARFAKTYMENVNFSHADLQDATFNNAYLVHVKFSDSKLAKTRWKEAQFSNVIFENNNMDGAAFENISSSTMSLIKMNIQHFLFYNVQSEQLILQDMVFAKAVINGLRVDKLQADNTTFTELTANASYVRGGNLKNSHIVASKLSIQVDKTKISNVTFTKSDLNGSAFYEADVVHDQFQNVDLRNVSFYNTNLKGTKFVNVTMVPLKSSVGAEEMHNRSGITPYGTTNLFMSTYDCATVWPKDMIPSEAGAVLADKSCQKQITPMDFHDATLGTFNVASSIPNDDGAEQWKLADFTFGDFESSNLQHMYMWNVVFDKANLQRANLSNSVFLGGSVAGADLRGATLTNTQFSLVRYDCATQWPDGFDYGAAGALALDPSCAKPIDLRKSNFRGSRILNRNFQYANAEGVRFGHAVLDGSDFSNANMAWVNAKSAQMVGVKFDGADVSHANFTGANLSKSSFNDTKLTGTILNGAILESVDMHGVDHSNREMKHINLKDANFELANFKGAQLEFAKLQGANVVQANFKNANLNHASFDTPKYFFVSSNHGIAKKEINRDRQEKEAARVGKANFTHADLSYAYLGDVDFSLADLDSANLKMAVFSCNAKWPQGFVPTQKGAVPEENCLNLSYPPVKLAQQDLVGVKLTGIELPQADLEGANLSHATLAKIDLSHANMKNVVMNLATYQCKTVIFPDGFDPNKHGAVPEEGECAQKGYGRTDLSQRTLPKEKFDFLALNGASFKNSQLQWSTFANADLSNADFEGADLRGADLSRATIDGAKFKDAKYDCYTMWPEGKIDPQAHGAKKDAECDLPVSEEKTATVFGMRDLTFEKARYKKENGITGTATDFSKKNLDWLEENRFANYTNINFYHASLRGAVLWGDLTGANFEGADLQHAEFNSTVESVSSFVNANLKNARFSDHSGIELKDLTGVIYDCRTHWGSNNRNFDARVNGAILDDTPCNIRFD
jgi:uncharacterized protein YjbI with pentapeptide repeats